MKDKSKAILIVVILLVAAIIAYVCYGITKGVKNPIVTMEVSYVDGQGNQKTGTVKVELYPDVAPESVANFIALANNGFYDGLTFHRIVKDFVVQGGDKAGDGSGSASYSDIRETYVVEKIENGKATCKRTNKNESKEIEVSKLPENVQVGTMIWYIDGKYQKDIKDYQYSIKGEFSANGVNNDIKFEKGVIAMARSDWSSYGLTKEGYNSASSQFFFVTTDTKSSLNSLNQNYAPFGRIVEGYDFIKEIADLYAEDESKESTEQASEESTTGEATSEESTTEDTATSNNTEDTNVPKMTSVRVETYGVNYGLPNLIDPSDALNQISQFESYRQNLINSQSTIDSSSDETGSNADAVVEPAE